MTDKINSAAEKIKQYIVVFSTFIVIFVNYLSAIGYINEKTPANISDNYPSLLTPAGYAFAIWSLIYLGLAIFSVYQSLPSQTENTRFRRIRLLYIINCAANCAWIFLWHNEMIWAALAVIFILLGTLVLINSHLQNKQDAAETWLARIPFGLYFGWVTVATILNFTVALVSSGLKLPDSVTAALASLLVVAASILGIIIRLKLSTAAYALAVAWALTAIAVKHGGETILVTCAAFGVIALLVASIFPLARTEKLS